MTPESIRLVANGLEHHVLVWNATAARARASTPPTALLLHGFMDAGASWDLVAPPLAEAGLRVIAPDLRGFGDTARVAPGGYYHFPDYVFDVAELVDALVPGQAPIVVVGHSMGGTVASMYAGMLPARVSRLALLEGAGPSPIDPSYTPERFAAWLEGVRDVRARGERPMQSREEALRRLTINHPRVDPQTLRSRLPGLLRELDDGRVVWKADPLHTTRSPTPFFSSVYQAFAKRVTCPVLFVSGGPSGWAPEEEAATFCLRELRAPRARRAGGRRAHDALDAADGARRAHRGVRAGRLASRPADPRPAGGLAISAKRLRSRARAGQASTVSRRHVVIVAHEGVEVLDIAGPASVFGGASVRLAEARGGYTAVTNVACADMPAART